MGCPYCGSEKIEIGVAWGKAEEVPICVQKKQRL